MTTVSSSCQAYSRKWSYSVARATINSPLEMARPPCTVMAPLFQFPAQLDVVEDLAVEHGPDLSILVVDRLVAAGEVDDAQSGVGQADGRVAVESVAVGAPMPQLLGHARLARLAHTATLIRLLGISSSVPVSSWKK